MRLFGKTRPNTLLHISHHINDRDIARATHIAIEYFCRYFYPGFRKHLATALRCYIAISSITEVTILRKAGVFAPEHRQYTVTSSIPDIVLPDIQLIFSGQLSNTERIITEMTSTGIRLVMIGEQAMVSHPLRLTSHSDVIKGLDRCFAETYMEEGQFKRADDIIVGLSELDEQQVMLIHNCPPARQARFFLREGGARIIYYNDIMSNARLFTTEFIERCIAHGARSVTF